MIESSASWQQPMHTDSATKVSCSISELNSQGVAALTAFTLALQKQCATSSYVLSTSTRRNKDGMIEGIVVTSLPQEQVFATLANVKQICPDFIVNVSSAPLRHFVTTSGRIIAL